jgi:hypothetical protein
MARSRNIKPSFYKNEELAECSAEARLLFPGLWTLADREGRLEDRPKRIKIEIFPYNDYDIDALLSELISGGFIVRYEVNGVKCLYIPNFVKHQRPHPNETPSLLPSLPENYTNSSLNDTNDSGNLISSCSFPSSSLKSDSPTTDSPPTEIETKTEIDFAQPPPLKGMTTRTRPEMIPLPEALETPEFRAQWSLWTAYFLQLQPTTPQLTFQEQLINMARWGPAKAIRSMQASIANGWKKLGDPDERSTSHSGNSGKTGGAARVGPGQKFQAGR